MHTRALNYTQLHTVTGAQTDTHTHTPTAAVAFNVDRWQIKKTYWLNLSSSAAIHLGSRTTLLAFNRKCKRMEIVSRERDERKAKIFFFSPPLPFFLYYGFSFLLSTHWPYPPHSIYSTPSPFKHKHTESPFSAPPSSSSCPISP